MLVGGGGGGGGGAACDRACSAVVFDQLRPRRAGPLIVTVVFITGAPLTRSVRRRVPSLCAWYSFPPITPRPLVPVQSVPSTFGPLTVKASELMSPLSREKPRPYRLRSLLMR